MGMKKSVALFFPAVLGVLLASCSSMPGSPFHPSLGDDREGNAPGVQTPEGERFGNKLVDGSGKSVNVEVGNAAGGVLGGDVASSMTNSDRQNMSRGLDKGLGKSSSWTNYSTGITYTIVAVSKVTVKDNPFCRNYNLTAGRGDKKQNYNGVACVTADGTWQAIRG